MSNPTIEDAEPGGPASPTTPSRGRYWPALDGLRGLAILVVIGYHLDNELVRGGALSLTVFFVLSGFLITRLLLDEWSDTGGVSFRDFYMRRVLRLMPCLTVLLLAAAVLALVAGPDSAYWNFPEIAVAATYLTNFAAVFGWVDFHYLGHTWSLATEEQFYLLWPTTLVLLLKRRWSPMSIAAVAFAIVIVSTALRARFYRTDADFERVTFGPDTRVGELMIGCIVAILVHYAVLPQSERFTRGLRIAAWISMPVGAYFALRSGHNVFTYRYSFSVLSFTAGLLLIDLQRQPGSLRERFLAWRPFVWVGRISYGLYLWHVPTFKIIGDHVPGPRILSALVKVGVSFAIATASFYLIETRFLKLKRHFAKGRRSEPTPGRP